MPFPAKGGGGGRGGECSSTSQAGKVVSVEEVALEHWKESTRGRRDENG